MLGDIRLSLLLIAFKEAKTLSLGQILTTPNSLFFIETKTGPKRTYYLLTIKCGSLFYEYFKCFTILNQILRIKTYDYFMGCNRNEMIIL